MTIFENERIQVKDIPNNGSKVIISDKFAPVAPFAVNRDAFEEMCVAVAEKVNERKNGQT